MTTAVYICWFLLPLTFFGLATYAKLEQLGGSVRRQNPKELFQQGFFVLGCVLVCCVIDRYLLKDLADSFMPDLIPLGFYQIILLPVILLIGAKLVGPTRDILISRKSGQQRRKRR